MIPSIWVLICSLLLAACQAQYYPKNPPRVVDGSVNIAGWDFAAQGPLRLKGEWRFFPDRLLTADDITSEKFLHEESRRISTGMEWRQASGLDREINKASFVLKVTGMQAQAVTLGIVIDQFALQHQIWLYRPQTKDLVLLAEAGRLGHTEASVVPQMKSVQAALPVFSGEDFYLIALSTRFHMLGTFNITPILNHVAAIRKEVEQHDWQIFFVLGMFFLLVISNFGLWVLRPEDKPSLLIAVFALLMGCRYFSTEAVLSRFFPEPSKLTFYLTILPIAWTLSFGLSVYFNFFNLSFRKALPVIIIRCNWLLMVVMVLATLIMPAYSVNVILSILGVQCCFCLLTVHHLIRLIRQRVRAAWMAFSGFTLLFLSLLNDSLVGAVFAYDFVYLGHYGMVAFTLCQSLVVGSNFAHAFRTAERLSKNLQQEVDQQTEKLRMQKEKLEEQKRILENQKKQLVEAHEELKDVDEQKTRFFRSISHELRTPLTLILGSLREQLQLSDMPDAVDMARRNAKRLYRLVNQLLDFQKIAVAKYKIRLEPINLNQLIQNLAAVCIHSCERKSISFRVSMDPAATQTLNIMGQIDALEKIVFNYLANALKYTPALGQIELILERRAQRVRIVVSDTGPGIPEDQQDKLFKLFSQIQGRHQEDKQGTGLGLALVKELAQLMQGSVGVESRAGAGARFWVEFPLAQQAEMALTPSAIGPSEDRDWHFADIELARRPLLPEEQRFVRPEGCKGVILVVDDVFDMRGIISAMLRSHGFHVLTADGGQQALTIVNHHPQLVDVVVTDWLMPDMDGPALIKALHAREESLSLPTILLTAKTDSESKAQGISIGASAYLGKPFDEMELLSTVENLLDLKKRERKIEDLNQFINQNVLQRFLPPDLVKDLLAGKAIFDDAARLRPVTIMFTDLCNFTRSTEILGPARIATILNDFFVRMTDVIFDHGGTIDKFLGDGILIIFGAPLAMDPAEQVRKACRCAKAMSVALEDLNQNWQKEFAHSFQMRIGLHYGPAIVGSFGGKRRSDYTAIGNTVNIAARVQANAEPGQILMTTAVRDHLQNHEWALSGSHRLKGVESEVMLFALVPDSLKDVA